MRQVRVYPFMSAGRLKCRAELLDPKLTADGDSQYDALYNLGVVIGTFGMSSDMADYDITYLNRPPDDMAPIPTASMILRP